MKLDLLSPNSWGSSAVNVGPDRSIVVETNSVNVIVDVDVIDLNEFVQ